MSGLCQVYVTSTKDAACYQPEHPPKPYAPLFFATQAVVLHVDSLV